MAEERSQRRLAAILAADVVGYSRLMGSDETGTLAVLKHRRKTILEPLVAKHQGRIFNVTGDRVMIEFGSAVNAVQCAADLQESMDSANSGAPSEIQIELRIGVNLGAIIADGGYLYGDAVTIAARLEAIAEPGSVVISGKAYDYVRNKVKADFEYLGSENLMNIEPVHVWRLVRKFAHSQIAAPLKSPE